MNSKKTLKDLIQELTIPCRGKMKKTTCIDRVSINSFHYTGQHTSTGWDTPYIGEISWFAGNFAPHGWALCDGQILSINEYPALFSILGTIYGGDTCRTHIKNRTHDAKKNSLLRLLFKE